VAPATSPTEGKSEALTQGRLEAFVLATNGPSQMQPRVLSAIVCAQRRGQFAYLGKNGRFPAGNHHFEPGLRRKQTGLFD
jgi:hypothetical protein